MTKKLLAKVGTYTNNNNEQKNDYVKLGVVMSGQNGEFMLLDPTVNLAGVLLKQNAMNASEGKPQRDTVMVSVFDSDSQQQGQQGGFTQPQQGYQQQQQGTQGYGQNGPQSPQNPNQPPF